ncbi:MAG: TetR/AcrR family transcriptional regulator [Chitinophagales bacterium]|nr:TetR/AcrR family transcriptional regulator [Chitinophagales bacterium]
MPKQKVDEAHIIKESLKLLRQKSYHTTSMADIANACGLLKGSLYHYFDSKEELMRKVILSVHDYFRNEVFVHAYDESLSAESRLQTLINKSEAIFIDEENGCIMGNVGVETALAIPEFASLIQSFFRDFFDAIKNVYRDKYPEDIADELAERSVAEVEGALMLARIFNDQQYLKKTHKRILNRLKTD